MSEKGEKKEKKIFTSTVALSLLLTVIFIPYYPTSGSQTGVCNNPPTLLQCGSRTDTITNAIATGALTQTFPTPFANPPASITPSFTGISGSLVVSTSYSDFIYSGDLSVTTAETFDSSAITGDAAFATNPFSFTVVGGFPAVAGEFAILVTGAGCNFLVNCFTSPPAFTVSSVSDTQGNQWTKLQSGVDGGASPKSELELWYSRMSLATTETVTVTYSNPNTDTVNAGAILSFYNGVAGVGPSAIGAGSGTSQTITVNSAGTIRANDFVVGGSVLAVATNGAVACDAITAGLSQTQRRVDTANCTANKIVNFDLQDRQWQLGAVPTFNANYAVADGNAIAGVELVASTSPTWKLAGNAFTELFGNTNHEVTLSNIGRSGQIKLHLTCRFPSSTNGNVMFRLMSGTTIVSNTITGAASTVCNGLDQSSTFLAIPAGTTFPGPFLLQGENTVSASTVITIEVTEAYFEFTLTTQLVPTFRFITITATGFTAQIQLVAVTPSTTITWTWTAQE